MTIQRGFAQIDIRLKGEQNLSAPCGRTPKSERPDRNGVKAYADSTKASINVRIDPITGTSMLSGTIGHYRIIRKLGQGGNFAAYGFDYLSCFSLIASTSRDPRLRRVARGMGRKLAHQYHPTWTAIDGLRDYAWRGERLRFPKLKPLLEQWAR